MLRAFFKNECTLFPSFAHSNKLRLFKSGLELLLKDGKASLKEADEIKWCQSVLDWATGEIFNADSPLAEKYKPKRKKLFK